MVKASIAGSSLGSSMVAGGKRKNGHKRNCGCHFCENMTKKAQRNGYEQDLERANEKKRGGPKKKNGHRLDCGCPICQNMMNSKKSQGSKYGKKTKKYRGGKVSVECGDINTVTGKIECHEAFIRELTELGTDLTTAAAAALSTEAAAVVAEINKVKAVTVTAEAALITITSIASPPPPPTSSTSTPTPPTPPSLMTTDSTKPIVKDIIAKLTALKNITNRADVDGGGSRKRRRTKKRRGSRRR